MNRFITRFHIPLLAIIILASGCLTSDTYQKQVSLTNNTWDEYYVPEFVFEITDTQASYEPQLLLRHDDNYPFSNIWLKIYIQTPNDSTYIDSFQTEVMLSDNEGYWLGAEQGLNWTHRISINNRRFKNFKQSGLYKVKFRQIMRDEHLAGVMNVGWRLDKR